MTTPVTLMPSVVPLAASESEPTTGACEQLSNSLFPALVMAPHAMEILMKRPSSSDLSASPRWPRQVHRIPLAPTLSIPPAHMLAQNPPSRSLVTRPHL